MKHNRHLASGNYFKFHKFKMKFKQYSLKENMDPLGILKLHFTKLKWSSTLLKSHVLTEVGVGGPSEYLGEVWGHDHGL